MPVHRPAMLLLLLAATVSSAQAHAFLSQPCARNKIFNSNYEPQSLSAGGPGVVGAGAVWPNGQHGICGDPSSMPRDHEVGGKFFSPTAFGGVYEQGSVVTAEVRVTAFHKGGFKLRVCRIAAGEDERTRLTDSCLDEVQLMPVGSSSPWFWFPANGGSGTYTVQYQLPDTLLCWNGAKCVFQWWWVTGNSCQPPAEQPPSSPQLPVCGAGASYPEEFWNCADVIIYPVGQAAPTQPTCSLSGPTTPTTPASPVVGASPAVPQPAASPAVLPIVDSNVHQVCSADSAATQRDCFCYGRLDGYFQNLWDSTGATYLACGSFLTSVQQCPAGYYFDPATSGCTASSPVAVPSDACKASRAWCFCKQAKAGAIGKFADTSKGCRYWFQCEDAASYDRPCNAELLFDEVEQVCNWANQVQCPAGNSGGSTPSPQQQPPSPSPSPRRFLSPLQPSASPQQPAASPLRRSPSPAQPAAAASPSPDACAGRPVDSLVRNPANCRQFLYCLASGPSAPLDCPATLGFDEQLQRCEYLPLPGCPA